MGKRCKTLIRQTRGCKATIADDSLCARSSLLVDVCLDSKAMSSDFSVNQAETALFSDVKLSEFYFLSMAIR